MTSRGSADGGSAVRSASPHESMRRVRARGERTSSGASRQGTCYHHRLESFMSRRLAVLLLLIPVLITSAPIAAQAPVGGAAQAVTSVPRAIRRDIPMTNSIRRAFEAGTRDETGRPGPNY